MQSPKQQWQAAFVPEDPSDLDKFILHWRKIMADPTVINKTILLNDKVVGNIGRWVLDGIGQITFWIDEAYEGQNIATTALRQYLVLDELRPLEGRCAFDNLASARVLEKNGFVRTGTDLYFANARNEEITEFVFRLL